MNKVKQKILITRIRKGDEKAFREVYKFFADKIYRYIFYFIPDKESVSDILQETFLKIWNFITENKDKKIDSLQALIFKTARNKVTDFCRSNPEAVIDIQEIDYKISDDKSDKHIKDIEIQINIQEVKIKLTELTNPLYKEIIELRFLNEMSYKEIADIIGKTEKHVSVLLHRALKELREKMK